MYNIHVIYNIYDIYRLVKINIDYLVREDLIVLRKCSKSCKAIGLLLKNDNM
jgi:hypothetical protein